MLDMNKYKKNSKKNGNIDMKLILKFSEYKYKTKKHTQK